MNNNKEGELAALISVICWLAFLVGISWHDEIMSKLSASPKLLILIFGIITIIYSFSLAHYFNKRIKN